MGPSYKKSTRDFSSHLIRNTSFYFQTLSQVFHVNIQNHLFRISIHENLFRFWPNPYCCVPLKPYIKSEVSTITIWEFAIYTYWSICEKSTFSTSGYLKKYILDEKLKLKKIYKVNPIRENKIGKLKIKFDWKVLQFKKKKVSTKNTQYWLNRNF